MYAIYGNMDPINIPPVMLALIYQHHGSYGLFYRSLSSRSLEIMWFMGNHLQINGRTIQVKVKYYFIYPDISTAKWWN